MGGELEVVSTLRVGLDGILTLGHFTEGFAPAPFEMGFTQIVGSLSASQTFGRYVAATVYVDLQHDIFDGVNLPSSDTGVYFGGALEFLF